MIVKKKTKKQGVADDLRPEYDFSALKKKVYVASMPQASTPERISCFFRQMLPSIFLTNSPSMPHCEL